MPRGKHNQLPPGRDWAALGTAIAALVTALIGAVPVIKDLLPEDPAKQTVSISRITHDPGWTYDEFIKATQRSPQPGKELSRPGALVTFDVDLSGYKDDRLEATAWILKAGSGERVRELWGSVIPEFIVPSAATYTETPSLWIALPTIRGKYAIAVAIYDDEDQRLAQRISRPLTIR